MSSGHDRVSPHRSPYDIIPEHVAFICDGNSRWATEHGVPTSQGHLEGADRLIELLEALQEDGISYCTLYAFSTENWKRPRHEIHEIFSVMEQAAWKVLPRLVPQRLESNGNEKSSIRIRILGDLQDERIPLGLRKILQKLQKSTNRDRDVSDDDSVKKTLTVCLAINYGGRHDILQATKNLAAALAAGKIRDEDITDETISSYLSTAGVPDPDLIVRTSGEHRLSNFLLWNAAYSELYVTDTLWPDFDKDSWRGALQWYQQRHRRFGARQGQDSIGKEEEAGSDGFEAPKSHDLHHGSSSNVAKNGETALFSVALWGRMDHIASSHE